MESRAVGPACLHSRRRRRRPRIRPTLWDAMGAATRVVDLDAVFVGRLRRRRSPSQVSDSVARGCGAFAVERSSLQPQQRSPDRSLVPTSPPSRRRFANGDVMFGPKLPMTLDRWSFGFDVSGTTDGLGGEVRWFSHSACTPPHCLRGVVVVVATFVGVPRCARQGIEGSSVALDEKRDQPTARHGPSPPDANPKGVHHEYNQ
jgi:hypothetical protein